MIAWTAWEWGRFWDGFGAGLIAAGVLLGAYSILEFWRSKR